MKSLSVQPYLVGILVMAVLASGCDDSITEFGYSGQISGLMTDQNGEVVRGNSATTDFRVFVLGPDEIEPLEIRVTHDGTYSNAHLYPQVYSVWVEGPVAVQATAENPATADLTGGPVTQDFTVTPFLSIAVPIPTQPSGNSIDVTYDVTPVARTAVAEGVIWASTASWPGPTTGTVAQRTHTASASFTDASGTVTLTGLWEGRTYHVRVGARAEGESLWNYSDQASVENP
jgi:hypothetical protein